MGERKNIDRLFQETFKAFESTPNSYVWDNIETELNKERKKNTLIMPLWLKISGIAAAFLILFGLSYIALYTNKKSKNSAIVKTDINDTNNSNLESKTSKTNYNKSSSETVSINSSKRNNTKTKELNNTSNFKQQQLANDLETEVTNSTYQEIKTNDLNNTTIQSTKKSALTSTKIKEGAKSVTKIEKSQNKLNKHINESNLLSNQDSNYNQKSSELNNYNSIQINNLSNKERVVRNTLDNLKDNKTITNSENTLAKTPIDLQKDVIVDNETKITENQQMNKESDDVELETNVTKTDIEDAIAIQEDLNENDEKNIASEKWGIIPNIAPVYYNTMSSGSPIGQDFVNNDKKGKINMSYGINVSYAVNQKFKLRSGINILNVGYSTENVFVSEINDNSVLDNSRIPNIDLDSSVELNISSASNFAANQIPGVFSNVIDSKIDQEMSYLEIPFEITYVVVNKKVSIDLIGGMSALLLNKNEIYATTNGSSRYLGKANNLNSTSFSTNLGIGFNYELSNTFNINFEPMFKYQINPFSNDSSGGFRPYVFGVYSGFSFKF